jgi:hypothetical protein
MSIYIKIIMNFMNYIIRFKILYLNLNYNKTFNIILDFLA